MLIIISQFNSFVQFHAEAVREMSYKIILLPKIQKLRSDACLKQDLISSEFLTSETKSNKACIQDANVYLRISKFKGTDWPKHNSLRQVNSIKFKPW